MKLKPLYEDLRIELSQRAIASPTTRPSSSRRRTLVCARNVSKEPNQLNTPPTTAEPNATTAVCHQTMPGR